MALTKEQRDALPDSDFAVPETRDLPMHDEKHVSMAWDMVKRTKGLTPAQRHAARKRIIERAHKLGMDTSGWSKIDAMQIEAMSLAVPEVTGHPNKMPFSGILVRLDQPSDAAPQGSGGRKIILTRAAAEAAIPSLLGMGIDLTAQLDGHDAQKKIGIITDATIEGDAIPIKGFIYAADFPDAAARIRATKDTLGFSFEAKNVVVADPGADPLEITACVFTGAAILQKDKAAYQTTALAAKAEATTEDIAMTKEELQAMLDAFAEKNIKPLADKVTKLEAAAGESGNVQAANLTKMVEPHAKALEAAAEGMEGAGIGGDDKFGHAVVARRMAGHLRASAALGKIPHIFRDENFVASASTVKPPENEETKKAIAELKDGIAALGTQLKDLSTKAFNASAAPERKTIPGDIKALLAKGGLKLDGDKTDMTIEQVDAALDAANVRGPAATETKLKLIQSGHLKAAA